MLWVNGSYVKWNSSESEFPKDSWIFISEVYNQSSGVAYVRTNMKTYSFAALSPRNFQNANAFTLGAIVFQNGDVYPLNGSIANVQLYNTPLSNDELKALYQEGIGGAPIDLQHLVGWWPLNGNANDYSGNGNMGIPVNVSFYSSYQSP